jgi:hypothetical protein
MLECTPDMGKRELHQPPPAAEGATEPGVRNMLVVVGGVEEIGIGLTTSLKNGVCRRKAQTPNGKAPALRRGNGKVGWGFAKPPDLTPHLVLPKDLMEVF